MTEVNFKNRRDLPWLKNLQNRGNEVSVVMHSEDGLSVTVPRSLLVASSELLKELLHDTCAHVDVHVSLAGVDANTLSMFSELLRSGRVKRVIDHNLSDTSHQKLASLLRSLCSSIGLVSQQDVHENETDFNKNSYAQFKDSQQQKSRKSLAGPKSKVAKRNANAFNESNAEIMQVFQETVPRESPRRFIDSGIATSTPRTSPVRPSTSAHVAKGKRSSMNRRDINVDQSPNVVKVKAEVIDDEFDSFLNKRLSEAGYDKNNDVQLVAYVCPFCKKDFRRHHLLKDHVNRFHPESRKQETKIECNLCNKQFLSKSGLNKHKKSKHSNEINTVRNKEFIKPTSIIRPDDPTSTSKERRSSKSKSKDSKSSKSNLTDSSTSKAKVKPVKKVCSEFYREDQPQNATIDTTADHENQLTYHCDDCSQIYNEADKEDHVIKTGHRAFTKFRAPRLPRLEF